MPRIRKTSGIAAVKEHTTQAPTTAAIATPSRKSRRTGHGKARRPAGFTGELRSMEILLPDASPTEASATESCAAGSCRFASRGDSKTASLVALLARKGGATIAELCEATGWQQHSVRGAIAGTLRKKGHVVMSHKLDGVRRYEIEDAAS